MPVSSHVDFVIGDDHQMKSPCGDDVVTSRADVVLPRLIRLYRADGYPEKIAHAMTASVAITAMTTMTTSTALARCSRKGLKPTPGR